MIVGSPEVVFLILAAMALAIACFFYLLTVFSVRRAEYEIAEAAKHLLSERRHLEELGKMGTPQTTNMPTQRSSEPLPWPLSPSWFGTSITISEPPIFGTSTFRIK